MKSLSDEIVAEIEELEKKSQQLKNKLKSITPKTTFSQWLESQGKPVVPVLVPQGMYLRCGVRLSHRHRCVGYGNDDFDEDQLPVIMRGARTVMANVRSGFSTSNSAGAGRIVETLFSRIVSRQRKTIWYSSDWREYASEMSSKVVEHVSNNYYLHSKTIDSLQFGPLAYSGDWAPSSFGIDFDYLDARFTCSTPGFLLKGRYRDVLAHGGKKYFEDKLGVYERQKMLRSFVEKHKNTFGKIAFN